MRYGMYYLLWMLVVFGLQQPWLLIGLLALVLLRKYIPDPSALWRAFRRAGKLKQQVSINPADVTARRDLALLYLDLLRPRAALKVLEGAQAKGNDQPELLYLRGLSLHRTGKHEAALEPLVAAVTLRPSHRYGLGYLAAGDALAALKRHEEALDAYERYTDINSSDETAYIKQARVHMQLGNSEEARKALGEARETWSQVRGALKRKSFQRWMAVQWARIAVIHEPVAIATAVGVVALLAVGGRFLAPTVTSAWNKLNRPSPVVPAYDDGGYVPAEDAYE